MKVLSAFGKYLDQPKLVKKFSKAVPAILIVGGTGFIINQVQKVPREERYKESIKSIAVLTATIVSALLAPKIAAKVIKEHAHCHHCSKVNSSELIDNFLKNNKVTEVISEILNKAKKNVLKFSEIKIIFEELGENKKGRDFLGKLIPNPENIDSKHIFSEIGKLSILGATPVLGGIIGGIAGDKLTEKDWKERIPNKIKEGTYQYLANIFLCNIGSGAALFAMEKAKIQSKSVRAAGMILGIILTGLIFGSAMANLVGKKIIDPMLGNKHKEGGLYSERTPELLDMGLHIDDIATVAVMSGLKWIEPALPILYSISGYRAGIGYRNNKE